MCHQISIIFKILGMYSLLSPITVSGEQPFFKTGSVNSVDFCSLVSSSQIRTKNEMEGMFQFSEVSKNVRRETVASIIR